MSASRVQTEAAADEAIEWMSLLRSGAVSVVEREAFARWREADPAHEQAWLRLERALRSTFDPAAGGIRRAGDTRLAHRVLLSPPRRRLMRGALALAGVSGGLWLARTQLHRSDMSTETGERRSFSLQDGSELLLNSQSAVDLAYSPQQRELHLRGGELIVGVAAEAQRPFVVSTEHGSVRALGTRFLVRRERDHSRVFVLHSQVELRTAAGLVRKLVAGEGARFDEKSIDAGAVKASEAAWESGFIEVHDASLGEFVAELQRYRRQRLRIAPEAAQLRVSGLFPIEPDAAGRDRALRAIEQTLPITVKPQLLWTTIGLR